MIVDKVGEVQLQINLKIKTGKIKFINYKLDPTLNWHFAEIISSNKLK